MPTIFISYRREDNSDAAGRIYDRLAQHFGAGSVFFDIDTIPFGVDFREHIHEYVAKCDVVLVVIGDNWLCTDDEGNLRLNDAKDFVRIELEAALQRDIPVVPVLVGNAQVPSQNELPQSLHDLAFRNAAEVRSGTAFQGQIERLIRGIEDLQADTANNDEPEEVVRPEPPMAETPAPQKVPSPDEQPAVSSQFFALAVCSVAFLLLIIVKLIVQDIGHLFMQTTSLVYFAGAAGVCIMAFFKYGQPGSPPVSRAVLLISGIAGLGMVFWAAIFDGRGISFGEIFPAWVAATIGFGVVSAKAIGKY